MQSLPNPLGQILRRRVLQSFNVVEAAVIQGVEDGLKGFLDVGKVNDPAKVRFHFSVDLNTHLERMAMHPSTLMAFGNVGQPMGAFKGELAKNRHGEPSRIPKPR